MKFKLRFKMDNAAFEDYPEKEIVRILRQVADKIDELAPGDCYPYDTIRDINGNRIGDWELE